MTRKIIYLILPLFLLTFVSAVNAQNTTTGSAQTTTNTATKLKQQMQLMQEQDNKVTAQNREEIRVMLQTKREEFRTRLQTIKDQKKKALVERIDARIAEVNKNQATKYAQALDWLQGFLDKMNIAAIDVAPLANLASAQTTIDTAKSAVATQVEKTYTMTITDELTLRQNAGTLVSQFRQDITAVHKLVMDAKQAVLMVQSEINPIKNGATSSAGL